MSCLISNLIETSGVLKSDIETVSSYLSLSFFERERLARTITGHTNLNIGKTSYGLVLALCEDNISFLLPNENEKWAYLRGQAQHAKISKSQLAVLNFIMCMNHLENFDAVFQALSELNKDSNEEARRKTTNSFERMVVQYRRHQINDIAYRKYYGLLNRHIDICGGSLEDRTSLKVWESIASDPNIKKWVRHRTLLKDLIAFEQATYAGTIKHYNEIDHSISEDDNIGYDDSGSLMHCAKNLHDSRLKLLTQQDLADILFISDFYSYIRKWPISLLRDFSFYPCQSLLMQKKRNNEDISTDSIVEILQTQCDDLLPKIQKIQNLCKSILELYINNKLPNISQSHFSGLGGARIPKLIRRRSFLKELPLSMILEEIELLEDDIVSITRRLNSMNEFLSRKALLLQKTKECDLAYVKRALEAMYTDSEHTHVR